MKNQECDHYKGIIHFFLLLVISLLVPISFYILSRYNIDQLMITEIGSGSSFLLAWPGLVCNMTEEVHVIH